MATDVKEDGPEAPKTESVVTRVTSLPLISSAYGICSSLYTYAKENHPRINTACNVVELVGAMAVGSLVGGVQPLLDHFGPRIATMNEFACKGLDRLEETLPCLHQQSYEVIEDGVTLTKSVVSSTVNTARDAATGAQQLVVKRVAEAIDLTKDIVQDSVSLTKSVVNTTVNTTVNAANEAKALVSHRVANVVNLSKETVQESVDLTKAVVYSTVNTALQAAHGTKDLVLTGQVKNCGAVQEGIEMTSIIKQVLTSGMGAMLNKTEELVDHYLPMTDEELVKLATEVQGDSPASVEEQQQRQSYFVRLGSLSSKVRHRAYLYSLKRLHLMKENTQNTLSQLQLIINLVEHLKQGVGRRFQEAQQKLNQLLIEWLQTQPGESQATGGDTPPEVESRTLAMLRIITNDLGPAYIQLVSSIEGLPSHLQERIDQAISNVRQLHTSFSSAASIQDLPSGVLAQSNVKIAQAREALDTLVDYIIQNTPLNWIVGPFRPSPAATVTEMEETPEELTDVGEATNKSARVVKEWVTAPKPVRVVHKSAKKKDKSGEEEDHEMKDTTKALREEVPESHAPKKAKKLLKVVEEAKANKSSLNQVSEVPEEGL